MALQWLKRCKISSLLWYRYLWWSGTRNLAQEPKLNSEHSCGCTLLHIGISQVDSEFQHEDEFSADAQMDGRCIHVAHGNWYFSVLISSGDSEEKKP